MSGRLGRRGRLGLGAFLALLGVLALALWLGGRTERRLVAEAQALVEASGEDGLTVVDAVRRTVLDDGRTVRLALAGDPVGVVRLRIERPGLCAPTPDCARALREAVAYARGQSTFAAALTDAFVPCGFAGLEAELVNVGEAPEAQFVQARLALDPVRAGGEPQGGADPAGWVRSCAEAFARGVGGRPFAPDDVADWAARPASLVVYLHDLAGRPEPEPPLLLGWAASLRRDRGAEGATVEAMIEEGAVTLRTVLEAAP